MKIRIRYFLLFLFISAAVGYFFGCLWPFKSIMYPLSDNPVDKGQNLENFISIFVALFTLFAVIVALFKDEIVGNFKSVDVDIDVLSDTVEEYLNESQGNSDPTVSKFFNQMVFKNKGNVNALDCELLLEKISFKSQTDLLPRPINITKSKVLIGGQDRTYIPKNGGHREADLIEIMATEDPDGNKKTQLLIADNPVPSKAGTWTVECCLNMSNASIKHCQFEIVWDGNWHEHKNNMQIQIKKI